MVLNIKLVYHESAGCFASEPESLWYHRADHSLEHKVEDMPRIAYCSPVNPAHSGISDYSEELLPYLGQYADITLYVEDGLKPSNPNLNKYLEVRPLRRLRSDQRRRPYDAILYHMGNSPVHAHIWREAQRLPGVMVMHEFVLHHFMLWYAANVQHNVQHYVRAMAAQYGPDGEHMAQLMIRSRFTDAAFDYPCSEAVIAAAHGLIAHSNYVVDKAKALRPELPSAVVPMGVPLPPVIDKSEARQRLGLPLDAPILASFGHINAYKRLEPALRTFIALRQDFPNAQYLLIGSASPNYDVRGLIERMGLEDSVRVTGFVSRSDWDDYLAATDICLNLRHPTAGETSASLLRLLGAGKATLVTASGSFTELPRDVAAQVDLGSSESDLLLAYCQLLLKDRAFADQLGANARAFVAREHSLERSAQEYIRFLAKLYNWPVVQRIREQPLWDVSTPPPSQAASKPKPTEEQAAIAKLGPELQTQVEQAATALVELGFHERDERVLRTVAERIIELHR